MIDPLSVIFVSGAFATMTVLASPVLVLGHTLWRRRAKRLNRKGCCGRCGARFTIDALFIFSGVYICPACAAALRSRLKVILPLIAITVIACAVSSGTALVSTLTQPGGTHIAWWMGGRLIPLLMPSVGVALATGALIAVGKRRNQLTQAQSSEQVGASSAHANVLLPHDYV